MAASATRGRPAPTTPNLKGDRLSWQGTVLSPNDTQAIFSVQFDGAGTAAQPKGKATLDFALTGGKAGTLHRRRRRHRRSARRSGAHRRAAAVDRRADQRRHRDRVAVRLSRQRAARSLRAARLSPFMGAIETEILGFANGTVTASGPPRRRARSRRVRQHHRARCRHRRRAGVAAVAAQRGRCAATM